MSYGYTTIRGKVRGLKRLLNTTDGNPRWEVTIEKDDGDCLRTRLCGNEQLALAISNSTFADASHVFGLNRDGTMDGRVG